MIKGMPCDSADLFGIIVSLYCHLMLKTWLLNRLLVPMLYSRQRPCGQRHRFDIKMWIEIESFMSLGMATGLLTGINIHECCH